MCSNTIRHQMCQIFMCQITVEQKYSVDFSDSQLKIRNANCQGDKLLIFLFFYTVKYEFYCVNESF